MQDNDEKTKIVQQFVELSTSTKPTKEKQGLYLDLRKKLKAKSPEFIDDVIKSLSSSDNKKVTYLGQSLISLTKPGIKKIVEKNEIMSIEDYLAQFLGEPKLVFHELVSPKDQHLDLILYQIKYDDKPVNFLVTSGLSQKPMSVPDNKKIFEYAELMVILPGDWPIDDKAFKKNKNYWPIRMLKEIAHLTWDNKTWIGPGHTAQHNKAGEPYDKSVGFTGAFIYQSLALQPSLSKTPYPGKHINFYALYPLYPEELDYAKEKGSDALMELFDKAEVKDLVLPERKKLIVALDGR